MLIPMRSFKWWITKRRSYLERLGKLANTHVLRCNICQCSIAKPNSKLCNACVLTLYYEATETANVVLQGIKVFLFSSRHLKSYFSRLSTQVLIACQVLGVLFCQEILGKEDQVSFTAVAGESFLTGTKNGM